MVLLQAKCKVILDYRLAQKGPCLRFPKPGFPPLMWVVVDGLGGMLLEEMASMERMLK